jgi:hypothetical protein
MLGMLPQRTYRGRGEIRKGVSALSAEMYTTSADVMVDIVKRGGRVPCTLTSLG